VTLLVGLSFVVDSNIYHGVTRLDSRVAVLSRFPMMQAVALVRLSADLDIVYLDKAIVMAIQHFIFEFFDELLSLSLPLRLSPRPTGHNS
jgi:hypothetical protein